MLKVRKGGRHTMGGDSNVREVAQRVRVVREEDMVGAGAGGSEMAVNRFWATSTETLSTARGRMKNRDRPTPS